MKQKSSEQNRIDRAVNKRKAWLIQNYPICIFCGHNTRGIGDAAHLIRRSDSIPGVSRFDLQTNSWNIWLAHRDCHEIFDDKPEEAKLLPQYDIVLAIIDHIHECYNPITLQK